MSAAQFNIISFYLSQMGLQDMKGEASMKRPPNPGSTDHQHEQKRRKSPRLAASPSTSDIFPKLSTSSTMSITHFKTHHDWYPTRLFYDCMTGLNCIYIIYSCPVCQVFYNDFSPGLLDTKQFKYLQAKHTA